MGRRAVWRDRHSNAVTPSRRSLPRPMETRTNRRQSGLVNARVRFSRATRIRANAAFDLGKTQRDITLRRTPSADTPYVRSQAERIAITGGDRGGKSLEMVPKSCRRWREGPGLF